MKEIKFRPLRRIKKTGKITVASYMQWRKIKTADYNKFKLIIDTEYKTLPPDEYVYNHEGENLFWRDYDPDKIPIITGLELIDGEQEFPKQWKSVSNVYYNGLSRHITYQAKGLDVNGVPAFNHYTADDIINSKADMTDFDPLTVAIVTKWFGWFLYQLENSDLKI